MKSKLLTAADFILDLNTVICEMQPIIEHLKKIEKDTIENHINIEQLNDRFVNACEMLPPIVAYITLAKSIPAENAAKLKSAIAYIDEILTEKKRILNNTPPAFIEMKDMRSLN